MVEVESFKSIDNTNYVYLVFEEHTKIWSDDVGYIIRRPYIGQYWRRRSSFTEHEFIAFTIDALMRIGVPFRATQAYLVDFGLT